MFYIIEFYKYYFFLNFELRSDPDSFSTEPDQRRKKFGSSFLIINTTHPQFLMTSHSPTVPYSSNSGLVRSVQPSQRRSISPQKSFFLVAKKSFQMLQTYISQLNQVVFLLLGYQLQNATQRTTLVSQSVQIQLKRMEAAMGRHRPHLTHTHT